MKRILRTALLSIDPRLTLARAAATGALHGGDAEDRCPFDPVPGTTCGHVSSRRVGHDPPSHARVPIHPDETLHSWVARLAMVHTGLGPDRLLEDLGLDGTRLGQGSDDVLGVLGEATGTDLGQLRAATITVRLRDVLFRGADFSRASLSPRVNRVCPACLAGDGERPHLRHRLMWCFRAVRWCARHGTSLHATTGGPAHDVRAIGIGEPLAEAGTRLEPPSFAAWVGDRVRCADDRSHWLATQTVDRVLAASEMIGAVLIHGHDVRLRHLDDA